MNTTIKAQNPAGNNNLSIFYINDIHGQTNKMRYILNASKNYDTFVKSHPEIGSIKISSGDICIGSDAGIGMAATQFKNELGLDVETLGNHEFDSDPDEFMKHILNSKAKLVITNMDDESDSLLNGKFKKSYVKEINGEKYGFFGFLSIHF